MASSRAVNELASVIVTRMREEVGDPVLTPTGDTRTLLKFAGTQYMEWMNDALKKMGTEADIYEGEALTPIDFTYTESATDTGQAVNAALASTSIIALEDISSGTAFGRLCFPHAIEEMYLYGKDTSIEGLATTYHYALIAATTERRILIKPRSASGRLFRAWYIANPLVHGVGGDTVIFSDRFAELIALEGAIAALSIDGEATIQQLNRYEKLWAQFINYVGRYKGPKHIKMVRR